MPTLTANRMLTMVSRYGTSVTLTKPTYGAYDPATGTIGAGTSTNYTVKCYFADYNLAELGNDNIVMGDRKALFPSVDTSGVALPEPDEEDTITGRGDPVKIVGVRKIYSGDSLVCYICQVRE